jgi:transglutaminase-like putative cysteine protease
VIKFTLFHRRPQLPLGARAFDLLCLTVVVVLAVHVPHLPLWLGAALAFALGLRWWQRRKHGGRAPMYLKLPLIALLSGAVIFQYGTLFGREPGAALAVGLLVLKLLETEAPRDARVGAAFACFALMTALLFDQGMLTSLLVALGLLPALATLRALEPAHGTTSLPRELLPALGLLGASLPLALLAFLLVPRLSSPLWGAPNPPQARTGLSDDMAPGDFFDLLNDDHPAMRVSFSGLPPQTSQRYFRAYVMSNYDGRRWSHVDEAGQPPAEVEHDKTVDYTIELEANGQRVLPALDVPINAPAQAQLGPNREVFADRPVNDTLSYSLQSALSYHLQPQLDQPQRRNGLQLPSGFNPRSLALAARWRAQYGTNDSAVIKAALNLFHDGGFSYTLAPAPLGRDSVDDFLFSTHEGFCQHYASAFTVLMRAAGIPARVVTGYQGGFWNAMGNYLLVRQSDAHAWSEVWLPQRGWTRVDPTAAVRPERVNLGAAAADATGSGSPNRWWLDVRNRWDIVNRWWNQGVIGFDTLRQRGLLTPFGVRDTDPATLGLLLAIGSIVFAAIGLAWAVWIRPPADQLRAAMQLLERRLAGVDVTRRHSEGPQHFFSRAARALPAQRAELDRLMRTYLELRYAHDEPPPNLVKNFRLAVQDFRPRRMVK